MSNSVAFLLLAVGLSVIGATAVWLHGRHRRDRTRPVDYGETLRVLSTTRPSSAGQSGVRPLSPEPTADLSQVRPKPRESRSGA